MLGMLSKSKGQVLRVAAIMHVLFYLANGDAGDDNDEESCLDGEYEDTNHGAGEDINPEISEKALKASINFVTLCCQQTAFIAGRGEIKEEIQILKASKHFV